MALVFPNIPGRVALIPPKDVAGFLPVQIGEGPGMIDGHGWGFSKDTNNNWGFKI